MSALKQTLSCHKKAVKGQMWREYATNVSRSLARASMREAVDVESPPETVVRTADINPAVYHAGRGRHKRIVGEPLPDFAATALPNTTDGPRKNLTAIPPDIDDAVRHRGR